MRRSRILAARHPGFFEAVRADARATLIYRSEAVESRNPGWIP